MCTGPMPPDSKAADCEHPRRDHAPHLGVSRSITLDRADVSFCDVSGLNALLAALRRVTDTGGSLHRDHPCPMVIRLLSLTGTEALLISRVLPSASAPVDDDSHPQQSVPAVAAADK
jgi:hypothetical protein